MSHAGQGNYNLLESSVSDSCSRPRPPELSFKLSKFPGSKMPLPLGKLVFLSSVVASGSCTLIYYLTQRRITSRQAQSTQCPVREFSPTFLQPLLRWPEASSAGTIPTGIAPPPLPSAKGVGAGPHRNGYILWVRRLGSSSRDSPAGSVASRLGWSPGPALCWLCSLVGGSLTSVICVIRGNTGACA
ncbi:uncharacterized protein LOC115281176 isoform X1 [Suricata suricatta]|uniref:uncharacterized protein LOC115281176 isoform X1 n=1 Tax=Suricata suricatta TaxID=37032 RepID=UPI001155C52B|nr:uncharacterized protein LOC115281176 isoform X1 [Suricata suricatta]